MVLSGIIAAAFACIYVGRTRKCRRVMVICGVLGLLAAVAFPLCLWLEMESYWIFLFIVMVQGVVFVTIQPLSLDYACDFMFPVGEAQISGLLISMGQILGLLLILLSQNVFCLGK
jgi:predicted membrane channel-forming protein YqfA (hemolysin III family)